jgi:hypothetical protein
MISTFEAQSVEIPVNIVVGTTFYIVQHIDMGINDIKSLNHFLTLLNSWFIMRFNGQGWEARQANYCYNYVTNTL